MHLNWKVLGAIGILCTASNALNAQWNQFTIDGHTVQYHGFLTQGFAASDQNNFLTMDTSHGSFALTDFGFNASTTITDKFRVGAQFYDRNVGHLGQWRPELDWAFGDYRLKDWLGIRAGKVKTVLGLFNDTQDMDFLHTFALMPQSLYPTDLRASTIAHMGVDLYGDIPVKKAGDIAYTAYVGARPYDAYGGYVFGLSSIGITTKSLTARQTGGDLRWNNLVNGLTFGASFVSQPSTVKGAANLQVLLALQGQVGPPITVPYEADVHADHRTQFYTEYKVGRLSLDGEYYRETENVVSLGSLTGLDERGWYAAATFHVNKRLDLGTYHSRYYPVWHSDFSLPVNHIYDQVASANLTLTHYWYLKLEGHFIDGNGQPYSFEGFYLQDNPQGLKPKTNMFMLRTGFYF